MSGTRRRAHARGFRPFRSGASPALTRGDASRRARRARPESARPGRADPARGNRAGYLARPNYAP